MLYVLTATQSSISVLLNFFRRASEAINHLAKVNNWNLSQALIYLFECFETWQKRSQYEWQLDISYLEQLGISTDLKKAPMRAY
ncbi:MAG: hypothetical protein QNJ54_33680 [Prochloraceae cyanobacterium]|nr:hypothetical protein [Prochloraceae cyanobacterium]